MTYSIAALDERSGQLGVGVASRYLCVGRSVPFGRPGVGVVATQAFVDTRYAPRILDQLERGLDAGAALEAALALDRGAAERQVAVVAIDGSCAVHTGDECHPEAEHARAAGVCAQGNMLARPGTADAMVAAFRESDDDLAGRLLAALHAGERHGGDARGRQSAALLVIEGAGHDALADGVCVDLRVDDASEPLSELGRLLALQRGYDEIEHVFTGGLVTGPRPADPDCVDAALAHLERAIALLPDRSEPLLWRAIVLARGSDPARAAAAMATAVATDPALGPFLDRLATDGVIPAAVRPAS